MNENPNIKTTVKHSESKNAWNIIGIGLGQKYKIARLPYVVVENSDLCTEIERSEALRHAKFISFCFNNSEKILDNM